MNTLIHRALSPHAGRVDARLDLSPNDIDEMTSELATLFKDAREAKRKVGCVLQQFGADFYFSYDDGNRNQLETSLVAALVVVPKPDVHVTRESSQYDKY